MKVISKQADHSIAAHALAAFAKRESDRSTLKEGDTHEVKLTAKGTVDGRPVKLVIDGRLAIDEDNPTGSSSQPDKEAMLAVAFERMPKTRLTKLLAEFEKGVPEYSDETKRLVKTTVKQLVTKTLKRGAVSFQQNQ